LPFKYSGAAVSAEMDGRPGTGMRGGQLGPLGVAGGGLGGAPMRPPTGLRQSLGTARMGTAMQGARAGLGPLNTNIQVAERPVTQQGMMGMKVQPQGPGRQVQDRSYYMAELRKRCDELRAEVSKMNREEQQYNKDSEQYNQAEKHWNKLIEEVRKLQGDLADLNLILDKSRNNTDPQDIEGDFQRLRRSNVETSHECDQLLMQRKHIEEQTQQTDVKIQKHSQEEMAKLGELGEDAKKRYGELQDDQKRLHADEDKLRGEYDRICRALGNVEEEVKGDRNKQRMQDLLARRHSLERSIQSVNEELAKAALSPQEMQAQFLEQAKKDKESAATYERNSAALEQRIKQAEQEIEKLESGGSSADTEEAKKYHKLQEKEKEMQDFISSFPETFKKEKQSVVDLEHRIKELLEHISKDLGRQQQLPDKQGFNDLQSEVAQKARGLDNALTTADRLKQEKGVRQAELEKIKNLDTKISQELKSLQERRITMTDELTKFGNIPQLRKDAETNKDKMLARKGRLDKMRKSLKQQVQLLSSEYEKHKQALATNESAGTLEHLEQKLRHYEQNIFTLRNFIDSKEAETDYSGVYEEVSQQVAEINGMLQSLYSAFN